MKREKFDEQRIFFANGLVKNHQLLVVHMSFEKSEDQELFGARSFQNRPLLGKRSFLFDRDRSFLGVVTR